jgi:G3E family GTPase
MTQSSIIPVHVLTGFLGSGKTTLLNRALDAGFGPETAVIVNEFGDIGLDQLFLQTRSEETIVLKSGCVCCTVRTDLVSTLLSLAGRRGGLPHPFRRIIVETSGISDPLPILQTLRSDFNLLTRFRVGAVVCTVDASQGGGEIQVARVSVAQITAADVIVVTKQDIAGCLASHAVRKSLAVLNPLADVISSEGQALIDWIYRYETMPVEAARAGYLDALSFAPAPIHNVQSVVIRTTAPASWSRFAIWLTRLVAVHGDRILRVKGVLFDAERGVWLGVHGVRWFFYPPVHLSLDRDPACGSCLVFITEGLDPARIEASYRRLIGTEGPSRD